MGEGPWRVVLVEDHDIVRHGLRALLAPCDDIDVVGEADTIEGAVAEVERTRPDIVVMDVQLRDGSGIDATRRILGRQPDTQILVLTSAADELTVVEAIVAGAVGYLLKEAGSTHLIDAIRSIGRGGSLLDPGVIRPLLARVRRSAEGQDPRLARLSGQETRVLALLADGKTNKDIAEAMFLAEKTVRNYVSSILDKLDVTRRGEAAVYYERHARSDRPPDDEQSDPAATGKPWQRSVDSPTAGTNMDVVNDSP